MNLRAALLVAQDGYCPLCKAPLGRRSANIDHVVPRAKGGRDRGNRLLAHRACNTAKADRLPTEIELRTLARVNAKLAEMGA